MKQILSIMIISMLFLGCNDSEKTKKHSKAQNEESEDILPAHFENQFFFLDSTEVKLANSLKLRYSRVPYFVKIDNEFFLYVCKGNWEKRTSENLKKYPSSDNLKYGIINKRLEEILPLEYDKIYSPNILAEGYIEVEKNGLLGLFNYKKNKVIECKFDVIFPSKSSAIAIGKIDNHYYKIEEDKNTLILDSNEIPQYSEILNNYAFDALDSNITYLIDSYYQFYEDDPIEGYGVVVTPSYLHKLNILPEIQSNLLIKRDGNFGIIESRNSITESRSIQKEITAFISSFYEEGVDGRGYQINQKSVFTIDKENEVLSNQMVIEYENYNEFYFCQNSSTPSLTFINDTLIELRKNIADPSDYTLYRTMPIYIYYTFDHEGKLKKLTSNRYFNFTKYVKLDQSYFKGCFSQYAEENKNYWGGKIYLTEHLKIYDLDVMRNEIFAEYGYRFKSKKWSKYFENKKWYSARYENVDTLLTEIDKHNIDVILQVREKLLSCEKMMINKTKLSFEMAG